MCVCVYVHIFIYIYREREGARYRSIHLPLICPPPHCIGHPRSGEVVTLLRNLYIFIYIYMYIDILVQIYTYMN